MVKQFKFFSLSDAEANRSTELSSDKPPKF